MMNRIAVIALFAVILGVTGIVVAGPKMRAIAEQVGWIDPCRAGLTRQVIDVDGHQQFACMRVATTPGRPLLVALHQWSSDYRESNEAVVQYAIARDLNYVTPDAGGPNNTPEACGSDAAVAAIDRAISDLRAKGDAADAPVVVIGQSGGGYAALNHLMRGQFKAAYYSTWVPITDLSRWYRQSRNRGIKYADDIANCTGLDPAELQHRSPLSYAASGIPAGTRVLVAAGINDGHGSLSVPISHSLDFFDAIAAGEGTPQIPTEVRTALLTIDYDEVEKDNEVEVIYRNSSGPLDLLVFVGGHDFLVRAALARITTVLEAS